MASLPILIATEHPAFAGHFPGHPIVPGVVLLDQAIIAVEEAERVHVAGVAAAKFLSPVGPGEALWLDYERSMHSIRFEIRAADRKVATGRMGLA